MRLSMLYVVATPIGNLQDISPRALEILKTVDLIVAEDTRVTAKLLNHYEIHGKMMSMHRHTEGEKSGALADRMLNEGLQVALVTDAGTPAVSDPGSRLVKEVAARGMQVQPIPGASAAVSAVSISGFLNTEYTFYGFLPREKKACVEKLEAMRGHTQTAILYESPHRVVKLLEFIESVYPMAPLVVSCDLTKMYEKTLRGTAGEIAALLKDDPKAEKGEYVVTMDLSAEEAPETDATLAMTLEGRLVDQMVRDNVTLKEAVALVAAEGEKKNALYDAALRLKKILKTL